MGYIVLVPGGAGVRHGYSDATDAVVSDGHLILTGGGGSTLAVYAPSHWESVFEDAKMVGGRDGYKAERPTIERIAQSARE